MTTTQQTSDLTEDADGQPGQESAALRAAGLLRDRIVSGDLRSGTPLRETLLAAELKVSRNTLREALRQLTHEGLVNQVLYKGAVVPIMTDEDVSDIFRARRAIQIHAVLESHNAPAAQLNRLSDEIEAAAAAIARNDWKAAGTASLHFHQAIVALIGSAKLDGFFHVLSAQLSLALAEARGDSVFQSRWVPRNRDICAFIRAGRREEARAALLAFIDASEVVVRGIVRHGWDNFKTQEAAAQVPQDRLTPPEEPNSLAQFFRTSAPS
ncbi:GntR family transcriptional regulator [Acidisoma silvae]|uniref:GntR family transcriptional regulator n=1 Tax=Acidisoma silvae TaxID=2802396 RepID=A0A963YV01_9PROT|nr:GntR family transcriptional regulator [Acidisoma silvae]MCB8877570.1 GntR family transcriptional regulator [Acidisoma silvae]